MTGSGPAEEELQPEGRARGWLGREGGRLPAEGSGGGQSPGRSAGACVVPGRERRASAGEGAQAAPEGSRQEVRRWSPPSEDPGQTGSREALEVFVFTRLSKPRPASGIGGGGD